MNFETMHRQRKWILLSAAVGVIAMFLPWFRVEYLGGSISGNGLHDLGFLLLIFFAICGIMSLLGDQTKPLSSTNWMVTLIAGALAFLYVIIYFIQSIGALNLLSFGYWLSDAAAVSILYYTYNDRTKGETLQSGFNSLKASINAKTSSPAPTNTATPPPANTTTTAGTTTVVTPTPTPAPTTDANKPVV